MAQKDTTQPFLAQRAVLAKSRFLAHNPPSVMHPEDTPRQRCYRCMRPQMMCLCASLPCVPTRTRVEILQHPRERTHPFNTARLAALSMPNARLTVTYGDYHGNLLTPIDVPLDTAVLYPHKSAVDLAELPVAARPSTLIVLDGTWAQARQLYRLNPWLAQCRHVRLHPSEPSNYRIRKEPQADYVSTVEAIVAALCLLEPETPGLLRLLSPFDRMVDRQIEYLDAAERRGRVRRERRRASQKLSPLLTSGNLLVVYAESAMPGGIAGRPRELVQWVAVRIDTGEVLELLLRPCGEEPSDEHLRHLQISRDELHGGITLADARTRFAAFAGPDFVVAAWTETTIEWGRGHDGTGVLPASVPSMLLKTAYCNLRNRAAGFLEHMVLREALAAVPIACRGRASGRVGNAVAVARWLRDERVKLFAEAR
ncbi:MAG: DTW domain-containing protein [Planctomycetes bacterium]|nr:DTW domain-containing protein [Planctomycetota bacterium]